MTVTTGAGDVPYDEEPADGVSRTRPKALSGEAVNASGRPVREGPGFLSLGPSSCTRLPHSGSSPPFVGWCSGWTSRLAPSSLELGWRVISVSYRLWLCVKTARNTRRLGESWRSRLLGIQAAVSHDAQLREAMSSKVGLSRRATKRF